MTGPQHAQYAEFLKPSSPGGIDIDFPNAGGHAIEHTTECPSGRVPGGGWYFDRMRQVLVSKGAESTMLADPLTDRTGYFFPLPQTARALENDGANRTNRVGRPCLQIEWVAYAERPFTRYWKPGPGIRAVGRLMDDWEIPHVWPSGNPVGQAGPFNRSRENYYNKGGHYGHCHVPGNSHWDPGEISVAEFFHGLYGEGGGETDPWHPGWRKSVVWPAWFRWPGQDHVGWGEGRESTANLLIQCALALHGYDGAFTSGRIDRTWTTEAQSALDNYKSHHSMGDVKGITEELWKRMGQMPTNAPDFPGTKPFTIGKENAASLKMQALLILQGFIRPLDGHALTLWRPHAKDATAQFQTSEDRLKVDPDGVPGPLTWQLAWTDND